MPETLSGEGDSASLDDFAGLDAAGADVLTLGGTLHEGADALDVRVPATLRATVRVRHRHTPRRALAAHFTNRCHDELLERNLLSCSASGVHAEHGQKKLAAD